MLRGELFFVIVLDHLKPGSTGSSSDIVQVGAGCLIGRLGGPPGGHFGSILPQLRLIWGQISLFLHQIIIIIINLIILIIII